MDFKKILSFNFKQKIIILLLLVSLIPTTCVGFISYGISRASLYERIEEDLFVQASNIMDHIDRFLYERHNDTQLLISDSVLIDKNASIEKKNVTLKEYLMNLGLYENIHIIDMEGSVIASTQSNYNFHNVSEEEWFKHTTKFFYYTSDLRISPFGNKPTILFSNVLLDEDNVPRGIIVAELTWSVVTEFLDVVPSPSQAFLLNKDHMEIGGGSSDDILKRDWTTDANNSFSDDEYLVTTVDSKGYLVYRGSDWKLILRTPIEESLAPLNKLFVTIGLFLLIILLIVTVAGLSIGNNLVTPIRKLIRGAEEIKHGNLKQRIHVGSKDEIGFLAQTFNEMSASILDKQIKLKKEIMREMDLKKEKDEIWTTASHNLRTPLTGINWVLETLSKEKMGKLNAKQKDAVNQINKNVLRLNYLVNVMLDVAKLEHDEINLSKSEIYLEEIIQNSLHLKQREIAAKNLSVISPDLTSPRIKMMLDPEKTQQVFNALIDNAIIYNNDFGKITIKIKKKKNAVICSVADTGIGIPEKDIPNIFNKFSKGENSEKKNATGIGLGLYLAAIIVRSSGGKLWVKSSIDQGSTFFVELPTI